ncbi:uncharacterized protein LOC123514621 isoform X2 [Portunus trituberculatus]|uniref:uncharacterized protein LOC123514621 isoform X2 n=1 Tax=Portunus trituberculatus TaxID=210409 RepID=UPI001E1CE88B|nr:uncharacterized protein LOC123514621 isoform X2 [Portunus trituberculatus]
MRETSNEPWTGESKRATAGLTRATGVAGDGLRVALCKMVYHDFPYQPTAIGFDPMQCILAIRTRESSYDERNEE